MEPATEQVIELAENYRIEVKRHMITVWTPDIVVNLVATALELTPGEPPTVVQFVLRTFDGETFKPLDERKTVLVDIEDTRHLSASP